MVHPIDNDWDDDFITGDDDPIWYDELDPDIDDLNEEGYYGNDFLDESHHPHFGSRRERDLREFLNLDDIDDSGDF